MSNEETEVATDTESKVEQAKRAGDHLRGTIAETLAGPATHFDEQDILMLKFHGIYQQDDRDLRKGRDVEKAYSMMARIVLPSGILTPAQYLALDALADTHANGTLRITTRQAFQFHGVLKGNLKTTIAAIHRTLITTLAACGDVERNVMGCPAPGTDAAHETARHVAERIIEELRPKSRAFHEIWLDGEKVVSSETEEPFYGDTYLPRKFKTGVALSTHNCVDVFAQDVGLIGIVEADGTVRRFNLLVGGGLGMTHGKGDTIARLGQALVSFDTAHAVEAAKIVAAIFRDHGNRKDRRHARLKYLVEEWGLERFREEFRRRAAFVVHDPVPLAPLPFHDHLEKRLDNGRWSFGVFVQSGRVADRGTERLKTALRRIVEELRPGVRLTAYQSVLLTGLDDAGLARAEALLAEHGVTPTETLSATRRYSMACPALPTCGLAVAESERALPGLLEPIEAELDALGLRDEPLTIRMTGCPNGCARPYTADIAFVGRSLGKYHVYVGGGLAGDRVADLFRADVKAADIVDVVRPLLTRWAAERLPHEGLSDFYQRAVGNTDRRVRLTGKEVATAPRFQGAETVT